MMLRNAVLAIFVLALAAVAAAAATGEAPWPPVLCLAIVVALILFERRRYFGLAAGARAGQLKPTAERFVDPVTGQPVQVWINAGGERAYVEDPPAAG